ncbi:MAG: hypothetical protein AAGI91_04650 [Bacteroidota bacterium]
MDRDEFNRIKEQEKAHLRKVRALKQQLREAKRKKGLLGALQNLDTSDLDAAHEDALRKLTEQNITSEARYELAMEALDSAAKQEADREELARLDAERQKSAAADLVQQMKTQMLGDAEAHAEAQNPADANSEDEAAPPSAKTIGPGSREAHDSQDEPEPDAPPARSIGRFGRDHQTRD